MSPEAPGDDGESGGSRDVLVPLRVYKTVTVFATLFAVVLVLAGFVILDLATDRASAPLAEVNPLFVILGLVAIAGGAAVYAFSTRFRAAGMGKPNNDADEDSPDG